MRNVLSATRCCAVLVGVWCSVLAVGVEGVTQGGEASRETRPVSVESFDNITGDSADDWMGLGIAETVATGLDGLAGLRVVRAEPTTSGLVVRGAFQRLTGRMRITARVTDVATGRAVATAVVDGAVDELFTLQDRLVTQLRSSLGADAVPVRRDTVVNDRLSPEPATVVVNQDRPSIDEDAPIGIDGPLVPIAPQTIARDTDGRATVRATALPGQLELDGVLDEAMYETVIPVTDFVQQMPDEGASATERTEAWVFFDEENVYISARMFDSSPESNWIANEMQRDSFQLISNDSFSVAFDTYYDRRNGFAFLVNPIGGFFDYQITDEGNPNLDWNPIWDVQTGRFDGGWTVEMEIPFKSLRFEANDDQIWGMQLGRSVRWKNEWSYITPVAISAGPGMFRLSAAGTLAGLEVPGDNRTLEIKPYAIGSLATDRTATPPISNQGAGDFGVDVKYGVTQNLTADFTYNTDFAQVEVDEQQVNLTRFSLFFPEKREFFLEGKGLFDFGKGVRRITGSSIPALRPGAASFMGGGDVPTVFFSRRIGLDAGQTVPILGGGRLTGKVGKYSIGALSIQTDDADASNAVGTNFSVIRVNRDVLRRSRIGAIFTGRSVATNGNGSNEVYGVDGLFSFYDNVNFNGYYAQTKTAGLTNDDASYQAAFTYLGDAYGVTVDHLLVGDNFNPEIGYIRRDDFRRTFTSARYSPRPASIEAIRQFTTEASLDYIENGAGQVETRLANARFEMEFENSDRFSIDAQQSYELLTRPFDISKDYSIPIGGYSFQDVFATYLMGPQRFISGTWSVQRGGYFNGNLTAVGFMRPRVEITPQFSVEPGLSLNRIELPEGTFTAQLVTSRVTYTFTPRMFFGGLVQYNSSQNALSMNLRLRWEYQPGSELFVVYNDQRDTSYRGGMPFLENRAFVVKFTRLFRY